MTSALRWLGLNRKTKRVPDYRPPIFWHRLWVIEAFLCLLLGNASWLIASRLSVAFGIVALIASSFVVAHLRLSLRMKVRRRWCLKQLEEVFAMRFPGENHEDAALRFLEEEPGMLLAEVAHYIYASPGCSQSLHRESYDGVGMKFTRYHRGHAPRHYLIFGPDK